MAAPMLKNLGSRKFLRFCRMTDVYRTFLSEAYKCEMQWKERLRSPYLQRIDPQTLGIELLERFEVTKSLHAVDVDLFVNKLQEISPQYNYLISNILHRFRHCNSSVPIQDKTMHAIVRGLMDRNSIEELVDMIKDRYQYGIFPDEHSLCMLLDHILSTKDYQKAADLAYHVMLQEDFESQTTNFLALSAAVKHFCHTMDLERKEPEPPADANEEIEYVAVKVIRNPYYDDHFDIKDERFLLGKTLYNISKHTQGLDDTLSRSLQLIGLGLYEKFEFANQLLQKWISNGSNKNVVCIEALNYYREFLNSAPTRDPDAEPVSMGDKTMDDEIELLRLTPDSKDRCINQLENMASSLSEERTPSMNIDEKMDSHLKSAQFTKYQQEDMKKLLENYNQWMEERQTSVREYIKEQGQQKKEAEILDKLSAIQEREELLTYFEKHHYLAALGRDKEKRSKVKVDTEEYVDVPGERNVSKTIKKKK